jgi:hypothetical protein
MVLTLRVAVLLVLFAFGPLVRSAFACSCMIPGAACQAYWNTSAVFDATVVGISPVERTESIGDREFTYSGKIVTLTVHKAWKGAEPGPLEVQTSGSGASCGYDFKEGQRYLVFAHSAASAPRLTVSSCSFTHPFDGTGPSADFLASLEMPARGAWIFGAVRTGQRVFDHERPRSEVDTETTVHLTGGGPTQTMRSTGGRYEFRGLAAGSYQVHIDLPQGYTTYSSTRDIEIPNVRACAQENFSLEPDGRIAGRVVGPDGSALKDVAVEVTTADTRPHPVYGLSIASVRSDAEGFFDVPGLPPGRYIAGVNLADLPTKYNPYARIVYPGPPNDPHVIELGLGQRADLGTWHMPPPLPIVRVQGVVTRRDGSPVPGVFVGAWDETDNPVERARGAGSAASGSDGRFVLELRKGRTYTFSVRAPQSKSLRISAPRIDTSADLPPVLHIVILSEGEMPHD